MSFPDASAAEDDILRFETTSAKIDAVER